jgi:CubicO group peptidase (beta-lactamase class C family)
MAERPAGASVRVGPAGCTAGEPIEVTVAAMSPSRLLRTRTGRIVVVALAALALVAVEVVGSPRTSPRPVGPVADAAIDAWFDAQRRDAGIPGAAMVVVRDGRSHTASFGTADDAGRPLTTSTPLTLGSVSKSLTALEVVHLAEAGRLSLDAPVGVVLPSFTLADPAAAASITIRELLDQTSGIPTSAGIAPLSSPETSLAAQVAALAAVQPAGPAGAAYRYSNANYVVLGRVIEAVTGLSYAEALGRDVLAPLGMTHASADPAEARADGLGDGHRLVFGVSVGHPALDRADLAPAGFVAASADDMAAYLGALLDPRGPGHGAVLSAAGRDAMLSGAVPTGVGDERYALGWAETSFRGERLVAHAGSTTDMAAFVGILPERGVAIAILLDAQSPLYEVLHKPDAIGLGVLALATGEAPDGTLEAFYPAFDLFVLLVLGLLAVRLVWLARSPIAGGRRGGATSRVAQARRVATLGLRAYLDVVVPVAILVAAPGWLGAGWPVLVRTDIGFVLAAIAMLRAGDGVVRAWRWWRGGSVSTVPVKAVAGSLG